MARKNHTHAEGSNSIHFDARTRTVMAEASHDNIKEKVQSVREVVPGKSNDEMVLVLQYYDYSVEKTIQAYVEDGARTALQEWNFTGSKQPNKKRKNKKKANSEKASEKVIPTTSSSSAALEVENKENAVNGKSALPNGHLPSDLESPDTDSPLESPAKSSSPSDISSSNLLNGKKPTGSSSTSTSTTALPQRQQQHGRGHGRSGGADSHGNHSHKSHAVKQRERTISEMSSSSGIGDGHSRKPLHGLEKAFKDLQRQTTSLERLRLLLDSEIDRSYKTVKNVFEELRTGLNTREAKLMAEMDLIKKEAFEMLETRQNKASDLKRQADRAEKLKESEITELRSEIKHFVSERRHDEELGRTTRFLYDSDHMMQEIDKFGEVIHVTKVKNTSRRPSVSSVASSAVSHDDNHEEDLSHSKEVSELQDRLKSSLGLQDSGSRPQTSTYNGSSSSGNNTEDYSSYRTFIGRSSKYRNDNRGNRSSAPGKNANRAKSPQVSSSSSTPTGNDTSHNDGNVRSADGYRGRGGRGGGSRGRGRGYGGGQRGRDKAYGNAGQNQQSSASQRQGASPSTANA